MPLFRCDVCNCVENTALGFYWGASNRSMRDCWEDKSLDGKRLCSECSPATYKDGSPNRGGGAWHGQFPKVDTDAAGYTEGVDGLLYKVEELAPGGRWEHYAKERSHD